MVFPGTRSFSGPAARGALFSTKGFRFPENALSAFAESGGADPGKRENRLTSPTRVLMMEENDPAARRAPPVKSGGFQ
mgnify:CR=1 FL=1